MSSLTAKDNQIRKKKRAIQERRDRVHKLEIKLAQLAEEYRERTDYWDKRINATSQWHVFVL